MCGSVYSAVHAKKFKAAGSLEKHYFILLVQECVVISSPLHILVSQLQVRIFRENTWLYPKPLNVQEVMCVNSNENNGVSTIHSI